METMRDWENNFQPNRKQNPAENLPSIGNDSRKYHFILIILPKHLRHLSVLPLPRKLTD